ncbi:putative integral membrane protein [Acanthocheilonema viteae]
MSSYKLSCSLIIVIICANLMAVSCDKISNAITARKREKRQFYGSHGFGIISVGPYFNLAWGNGHSGWHGPWGYGHGPWGYGHGWGGPWHSFGPFGMRRRFMRRRWEIWDGLHEDHGPWFA